MTSQDIFYDEEERIKALLLGRRVVSAENGTLTLDNGTTLDVLPNEGCGGCSSGWFYLEELNECNNAIMDVEFDCVDIDTDSGDTSYRIFVYADGLHGKKTLLRVEGTDGNGYYGTGYRLEVTIKGEQS